MTEKIIIGGVVFILQYLSLNFYIRRSAIKLSMRFKLFFSIISKVKVKANSRASKKERKRKGRETIK